MDPELQRRAHAKAAELGLSFAEYVRRLVAHDLGEPRRNTPISLLFDLGASREPTDIARDKDQMLAEAAWAAHVRKTARLDRKSTRLNSSHANISYAVFC